MPTSFGNADEIAAKQPSELKLSARDFATRQNGGAAEYHNKKIAAIAKWKVRWKPATSAVPQTNAAESFSGTTLSNSSSILPQVPARSLTAGQENTGCMMHTQVPLRHAFVQGNVVSTNNTGPVVVNAVQIGNPIAQGNDDSTNNMGLFATNVVQTGPYGGSISFNPNILVVCSASSYTKRRRVKWKLRLTNCDARDTGQKGANTADLRATQIARGMGTIHTQSPTALNGNLNGAFNDNSMAISRASSTAVTMKTATTVGMTAPKTISMATDNDEDRNMDNDGDKDKFRDNDNGRDNNNASQFTASWQNEPIGLAELTGVTEYKIEGDRGEGSGGPSHSPP